MLTGAGFVLERLERGYRANGPRPFGPMYEGVARG